MVERVRAALPLDLGRVPLSQEYRRRFYADQHEALAEAIGAKVGAVVTDAVENLVAEHFNQGVVEPVAGRAGYQELVRGDKPPAGTDWTFKVSGANVVEPLSVMARLTTDANAGLRSLTLEYRDADGVRYLVAGSQAQLDASQQQSFCWQPSAGDVAWPVADVAIAPLPTQRLYGGASLVLHIGNVQAGDQLDQVRLAVSLYPTGPQALD